MIVLLAVFHIDVRAGAAQTRAGGAYNASSRTLTIVVGERPRFRYVFNKGGAINGIYDLRVSPQINLIGDSFQGETTDRVVQWTYWNSRYLGAPHQEGDGDRRANVTMEGCFHQAHTCEVLQTPKSGVATTLLFRSRIAHWFYASLDRHGAPDFETTSRYKILQDGSLELTREVLRRPWQLRGVVVKTWDGKGWQQSTPQVVNLSADHLWHRSMTSYFEGWTPLRRSALPKTRHALGEFEQEGYQFWNPQDLGGWAMAYGDQVALSIVFGQRPVAPNPFHTQLVFNRLDQPQHNLNILLPGVETDWPDNATLAQTLVLVAGEPRDVMRRAKILAPHIAPPEIRLPKLSK